MAIYHTDLTGKVFGRLTVVRYLGVNRTGKASWWVRCECGKEKRVDASNLTRKNHPTRSCGCWMKEQIRAAIQTHGMSHHPAYAVWRSMVDRCRLPTHQAWKNYGGRGIRVCPRWENFESFWSDMRDTYVSGLCLERKDNEKGYSPENCCWASYTAQNSNRRDNRMIHTPWGRITLKEASRKSGIGYTTLLYRLDNKVPMAHMFDKPDLSRTFPR